MAVTQQLARVTEAYLARCRASAAANADADPEWYPPDDDWIDLDWAPRPLVHACELAGVRPRLLEALQRAVGGDLDVDVSMLRHPEATGSFGPPPTALAPDSVARVAAGLAELDWEEVWAAIPEGRRGTVVGDGFTGDQLAYLAEHFTALREFYLDAARRGLSVVLWWD
ncbi:DUF1877 family protein [Streptomyces sp. NPDC050617]|uniref:DUF1877 family protein n=1 Tax=Streptomyces sp. NPDC050617 TaxID=3154628 RepID=UPI00344AE68F